MIADEEIPDHPSAKDALPDGELDPHRTRQELDAMVETMWTLLKKQQAQIIRLERTVASLEKSDENSGDQPAPWLTFSPPPAAEDKLHHTESPLFTLAHFVQYYNEIYVGKPGTRAVAIPDCWRDHPALLAEIATLAYTWRAANIGKAASARDAQYWHHYTRPGFAERLVGEWTHTHCLTDTHKPAGALPRLDRFASGPRAAYGSAASLVLNHSNQKASDICPADRLTGYGSVQ